jgi:signal transduction histidine kinase
MVKKLLPFLLLAFSICHAQNPHKIIDTLKAELSRGVANERKAAIYSDLTWYYANVSIDSALHYGKKALTLGKTLGNDKLVAQVYSDLGAVYLNKGDIDASYQNYLTCLKIRRKLKDEAGIAGTMSNLGVIYERIGQRDSAMANYTQALAYFETKKDNKKIDLLRNNMGLLYEKMGNYTQAEKLYTQVAEYRKATNQKIQLAMVYVNLGNLCKMQDRYPEAENYYNNALQIGLAENDPTIASTAYMDLGFLYNAQEKPKEAIPFFEKSLALAKGVRSDFDLAKINNGLGIAYAKLKQEGKAKEYYLQALGAMKKMDRRETERLHLDLVPLYGALNMPDSAQYHLDQYKATMGVKMKDRIFGEAMELEKKYETEKKEKELLIQQAEVRRRNTQLIILSIVVVFSLIVAWLVYRQQKLKNSQMRQEFSLKEALSQIETQNRLQQQRLEISKDLHDNIGSQLTFIISSVDNINDAYHIENPAIANRLNSISAFTRDTILELRDTIWAMNTKDISFENLRGRIFNFIEKAREAREDIHFSFTVDKSLDAIMLTSLEGMNVYRALQEAVNNCIRHSGAGNVAIAITPHNSMVRITIADDGNGFDPLATIHGNGLTNMEKRMEAINGTYSLESAPGKGTVINITLPCKQDYQTA